MSKSRYLLDQNPLETIKHIRKIDGISKAIRLELDRTGNLDAKVYLFFAIVLGDKQFVKDNLGEYKNIDTISAQELYLLAERFKNKLKIQEGEENKFPISEYGINLYQAWLDRKQGKHESIKNGISVHRGHIEEDFEDKIVKTNTLLGQDFDISQRISDKPIIQLIESYTNYKNESFYSFFKRMGGGEPDFNQNVVKNINAHGNLLHYIRAETRVEDMEIIKLYLKDFFTNVNNLYFTLTSLYNSNTGKNNSQYSIIKETIKDKYIENNLDVELIDPAEKEFERAFTKLLSKYAGKVFKLKDLHRCSFVFHDLNSMVEGINLLLQSLHNKQIGSLLKSDKERNPIIELEDKIGLLLSSPQNGSAYRDINFVLHFRGDSSLIPMEIQLHLQDTKKAKKEGISKPFDLVAEHLNIEEIDNINNILRNHKSIDYLPTNNDHNLNADNIYHIVRKFKNGKLNDEYIDRLRQVENSIHETAWVDVLRKLEIFDILGNTHPLGKSFKKLQSKNVSGK